MKKVAFILAIAFVFLVGEKILFEHKVWAGEQKKAPAFLIPINEDGEFDLGNIAGFTPVEVEEVKGKKVIPAGDWQFIESIQTAVIIKYKKNPYCWLVCSGGSCVKKCIP